MKDDAYITALHNALLSFQMIEEGLKVCVGMSYEIIQATAPPPTVFNFDKQAITEAPLGRLVTMYSRVSINIELANDLRKILEWRNFCAHSAFMHELLSRTGASQFSAHTSQDLATVIQFSSGLLHRLVEEMKSIREQHAKVVGKSNASSAT